MGKALVAKSYQSWEQIGEVYSIGKKQYVNVRSPGGDARKVKVYTEAEYKRYYGEVPTFDELNISQKKVLGFALDYITIFKGDTYESLEWFQNTPECRYCKYWGWYVVSTEEVPADLPEGVEPVRLPWSCVGKDETLLPIEQVKTAVASLIEEPCDSEYQGEVGETLELYLTIEKVMEFEGYYGKLSFMHIMYDDCGNLYVWNTASRRLDEGTEYHLKGKVKEHKQYRNQKQTVLTRCKILD